MNCNSIVAELFAAILAAVVSILRGVRNELERLNDNELLTMNLR